MCLVSGGGEEHAGGSQRDPVSFLPPLGLRLSGLCGRHLHTVSKNIHTANSPVEVLGGGAAKAPVSPLEASQTSPRAPQDEPLVWSGTHHPLSYEAVRTLGPSGEKGHKSRAQPGSAGVHQQEHRPAGLAQNSLPDARTYFILFCSPECTHTHK